MKKTYSVTVSFQKNNDPISLTYRVGKRFNDKKECIPVMKKAYEKLKKEYHFTREFRDTDILAIGDCGDMSVMIYIFDDDIVSVKDLAALAKNAPNAFQEMKEKMQL
jgi:hypothetical protein